MVIVAGHILVAATDREDYLAGCVSVVEQARAAPGCLDFALSPDLLDLRRINIYERWETPESLAAFRGEGPGDEQNAAMLSASVAEYDVAGEQLLS